MADEVSQLVAELEEISSSRDVGPVKKKRKTVVNWVVAVTERIWSARRAALRSAWRPEDNKTSLHVVDACRQGARQYGCPPEIRARLMAAARLAEASDKSRVAASGVVATLDLCYYTILAYEPSCPRPHEFFKQTEDFIPSLDVQFEYDQKNNPLAHIYVARQQETSWLFSDDGQNRYGLIEADDARGEKLRDPVATVPLTLWRDAARTGAAHHYAFAVPSTQVLDAILRPNKTVIDIGAGTGYWADQLQRRSSNNHHIAAYDAVPCGLGKTNLYHGKAPSWFQVERLDASRIPLPPTGATLLVVYPPCDPEEAFLATLVHRFARISQTETTNRLALVAEWRGGDTASAACRTALIANCTLESCHPVPNWGDTSVSLTIWKPRISGPSPFCPLDKCSACGTYPHALFRCRLSCDFQVCSRDCALAAADIYQAAVAAKCYKHILPPSPPDIANTRFFRRIAIPLPPDARTRMTTQEDFIHEAETSVIQAVPPGITKRATLLRKKKKKHRKKRKQLQEKAAAAAISQEDDHDHNHSQADPES